MYPLVNIITTEQGKKRPKDTYKYLELLTIFPDDSDDCAYFLGFLDENNGQEGKFQKLWPK
jgi:CRISPR-associated protein Cmr6